MLDNSTKTKYRQMYFDMDGVIKQETYVFQREMTAEEQETYENLVADSNQMTIFDFISDWDLGGCPRSFNIFKEKSYEFIGSKCYRIYQSVGS